MKHGKKIINWNTTDDTKDNYISLTKNKMKKILNQEIDKSTDIFQILNFMENYFRNLKNDMYMDKFYFNTESAPSWWIPEEEKIFEFNESSEFLGSLFELIQKESKNIPKKSVWSKKFENALKYFVFNSKIHASEADFNKSFQSALILLAVPLYGNKDLEDGQHLVAKYKIEQLMNEARSFWPTIEGGPIPS